MFAARDQENLLQGHQAGSKPPLGKRIPKTPLKLPLNDENGNGGFGPGKAGLKTNGAIKNAFITPMGPKTRAPLGAKTTNAKAKAFQTPAPQANNEKGKTNKGSVSARKPKPKPAQAEVTKLNVLGDEDEPEVPEIEYMPPRSKPLPDIPDDLQPLDLSMFKDDNLLEGAMSYFANRPGPDGLSILERQEKEQQEKWAIDMRKEEAKLQLEMDSLSIFCTHYPECPGEICKDTLQARKEAEEEYEKTIAIIDAEAPPKKPIHNQAFKTTGPSTLNSKAAAATLSQPKPSKPVRDPVKKSTITTPKPRFGMNAITQSKKAPPPANPSPMRHTASTVASRTTLGRAKGRAVSSNLRKTLNSSEKSKTFVPFEERDTSVAPTVYFSRWGEPPLGSDMWFDCWKLGLLGDHREQEQESEVLDGGRTLDELIREDALEDFQLTLGN